MTSTESLADQVEIDVTKVSVDSLTAMLRKANDDRFVPANGVNTDWAPYYTVDLHDNAMPPRAELSLAEVLAVVAEYTRTRQRPKRIEWTPAV